MEGTGRFSANIQCQADGLKLGMPRAPCHLWRCVYHGRMKA